VIALDLPGYGRSDTPDEKFVISYYVQFFEKFISELGFTKFSLAGISMGGAIAIGYTLQNPKRVDKLVLVDSYGLQQKAPFHKLSYLYVNFPGVRTLTWWLARQRWMIKYSLGSILKRPGSITEELLERVHQQALQPGAGQAFADLQDGDITWSGLKTVFLDRLPEVQQKTLVIHGGEDTLVPLSASQEAARLIPNAEFTLLEGCGHWPQRDNPAAFNQLVTEFLSK
jgi:pimeloyl-ACP methyl ester carboxylesterase